MWCIKMLRGIVVFSVQTKAYQVERTHKEKEGTHTQTIAH